MRWVAVLAWNDGQCVKKGIMGAFLSYVGLSSAKTRRAKFQEEALLDRHRAAGVPHLPQVSELGCL